MYSVCFSYVPYLRPFLSTVRAIYPKCVCVVIEAGFLAELNVHPPSCRALGAVDNSLCYCEDFGIFIARGPFVRRTRVTEDVRTGRRKRRKNTPEIDCQR